MKPWDGIFGQAAGDAEGFGTRLQAHHGGRRWDLLAKIEWKKMDNMGNLWEIYGKPMGNLYFYTVIAIKITYTLW